MLEPLIRLGLRYRNLTLGFAVVLALAGLHAWLNLPIDAFPDISPTQAKIILKIPGMTVKTFYNRGELVTRAADTVIKALIEASVLVCVILYLFLGGVRAALVVVTALTACVTIGMPAKWPCRSVEASSFSAVPTSPF